MVRLYEEFLSGKTVDYIARIFRKEKIKSWDGKCNWLAALWIPCFEMRSIWETPFCRKSYTADFLSKKRVMNDGTIQMYHIEEDHEPIIDVEIWEAVQQELERGQRFCEEHRTNTYAVNPETNPFSGKVVCGNCNNLYSRGEIYDQAGEPRLSNGAEVPLIRLPGTGYAPALIFTKKHL